LRGVGAELKSGLIGGLSEVRQEVANLLLALIDDRPSRSGVDGGGHVLAKLLEATA